MPRPPRRAAAPRGAPRADAVARAPRVRLAPELRRAEVLDAAVDAFAEHGFAETTFADVAARAGVSKGAVYHYFETKEGLFEAVVEERLVPAMVTDEALLAAHGGSAGVPVEQMLGRLWDTIAHPGNASLAMIALLESARIPAVGEMFYRDVIVRWRRTFHAALSRAVDAGQFPADLPVESLSWSLPPMVVGAVLFLQGIGHIQHAPNAGALARGTKADTLAALMAGLRGGTHGPSGVPVSTKAEAGI